jgi:hypothetical protein
MFEDLLYEIPTEVKDEQAFCAKIDEEIQKYGELLNKINMIIGNIL